MTELGILGPMLYFRGIKRDRRNLTKRGNVIGDIICLSRWNELYAYYNNKWNLIPKNESESESE